MFKRFAFVSFGVLCLVAAYQLVTTSYVEAQSGMGPQFVGIGPVVDGDTGRGLVAITATGDLYTLSAAVLGCGGNLFSNCAGEGWVHTGNVLDNPIGVESQSWSGIKGRFKKE